MTKYHQVTYTLNEEIVGKEGYQYTIEINSNELSNLKSNKAKNIEAYFKNFPNSYNDLPDNIVGKLIKRKKTIDIMDVTPFFLSLKFIVSEKVKLILERLNVSKEEYFLKEIKIDGFSESYFMIFIPILKSEEYLNFSKTIFLHDDKGERKEKVFNDFQDYKNHPNYLFDAKTLVLSKDIFELTLSNVFFSERIIQEFEKENIVGFDTQKPGSHFYQELLFE